MTHRVSLLTVAATVRDAPTACLLQGCECEMRLLISVVNWSGIPLLIYLGCVFDFSEFPDTGKWQTLVPRGLPALHRTPRGLRESKEVVARTKSPID